MAQEDPEAVQQRYEEPKAFISTKEAPLNKHVIKYNGIFDLDSLYKMIYEWFMDRGYYFEETGYKHKVPNPSGAEDEVTWSGWRKTTEYMREWVTVYFFFWGKRDVEVIKEGKKVKLTKSRMLIELDGRIELDYQKRWEQSQFGQYLRDFYHKYIVKKELESIWWDRLYYIMLKLHNEIKEFLDMQSKENAYYDMW